MTEPFLLQFAEKTGSPTNEELGSDYYFDPESDLLRCQDGSGNPAAIDREGESGPETKKNDVEKGDDNKDRGMWM
jgi:hypothetical protein